MKKVFKNVLMFAIIVTFLMRQSGEAYAVCFTEGYCPYLVTCDYNTYDPNYVDNCPQKHKREYGIKLCANCIKTCMGDGGTFYKRGYADYNCLAYAIGKNAPCSWTWPWGGNPTLAETETYLRGKGYSCWLDPIDLNKAGGNIIFIYGKSSSEITHFARRYTLDGKRVTGAATIAKLGYCSLYKTTTIDSYTKDSRYGTLIKICATSYSK